MPLLQILFQLLNIRFIIFLLETRIVPALQLFKMIFWGQTVRSDQLDHIGIFHWQKLYISLNFS